MNKSGVDFATAIFEKRCREHNLKITPQRTSIYKELFKAKDHPSADMLYKRMRKVFPNISFDTVYRTLLSFSEIGLADVVEGYGEPKRFDPNTYVHHHFRCMKCGKIKDLKIALKEDIEIPEEIRKDIIVIRKRIIIEGFCKDCKIR
jgi:Fur family peroxide stress response transcriptional regulator